MSSIVEFEGKTVEEALKKATEKLNLPSGKLKHDVISHGSSGIFGLVGTKKARIRVAVPDETQLKSTEKEPEEIDTSSAGVIALVEEAFNEEGDSADAGESTELGKTALQKIVDLITSDAAIAVSRKGEKIVLSITGGNTAIMIGKRGQTLEAMQYLVEKIVNKQSEKRVRVEIDVEGYLEDKREKLEKLALKLSENVKQTKKPATVGQLNAHDRRIVHLALKADSEIKTLSLGEGYYRKLKIFPKNRSRKGTSS